MPWTVLLLSPSDNLGCFCGLVLTFHLGHLCYMWEVHDLAAVSVTFLCVIVKHVPYLVKWPVDWALGYASACPDPGQCGGPPPLQPLSRGS